MKNPQAVLITGAAKRVGAELALHFAAAGWDIGLHYRHSKVEAHAVKEEIEEKGRICTLFQHDMHNVAEIPKLMEKVKIALPHCVALINNASVIAYASLMETTEAVFDEQLAINFKAPFFATQAFAKTFGKGCVVNVLDTDITQTKTIHFAYLLAKKSLAEFTFMAARELGPHLRVNAVCPGVILSASDIDTAYAQKLEQSVPLKTQPTITQLAQTCEWLVNQPYITAQQIFIDGGKHVL